MNKVFQTNDCPYELRNARILASKHKSTVKYGINTIAFKGPQIWQRIPFKIKKLGISLSFQIEYKTDTELILPLQNLSFIHS